jgi:outer membrane protein TolC
MPTKLVCAALVLAGLLNAAPALAQPDSAGSPSGMPGSAKSTPSALEDMLEKALKQNPDILVAEAKVQEAQAELNRVRQQIMAKIVMLKADLDASKGLLKAAKTRLERLKVLSNRAKDQGQAGIISEEELTTSELTFLKLSAEHAGKEAELQALVGKKSSTVTWNITAEAFAEIMEVKRTDWLQPSAADDLRNALNSKVAVKWDNAGLVDVLRSLQPKIKTVNLLASANAGKKGPVTLTLSEPITLLAALQLLEDTYSIRFVLREYGIVGMDPASIPAGAVPVSDLARQPGEKKSK